ncbi:MAG: glycoside hydrolase family 16 protein [Clostridia bacterium]|nr:glycoside hydrolase family 16 protein [Clostridia bacterium]
MMNKIDFKSKKFILISALALLLITAIVLLTVFWPFGGDDKTPSKNKKPSGNTSNVDDELDEDSDGIDVDDDFDYGFEDEEDNILYLNEFDYFSHQICYPDSMEEAEVLLVNRVYTQAHEKYTALATPTTDAEPVPEAQFELLIGNTNRQISKDALALLNKNKNKNANDYIILEKDGNIAITALSTAALEKAVDYFIASFMSEDYPEMEKGYCYVYQKSPVIKKANIAGVDFRQWKIVVPNGCSYIYTRYLYSVIDEIREATGYEIPLCFDKNTPATAYEILVGDTNRKESTAVSDRDSYYIKQVGKKLVINGGHTYSLSRATKAFYDLVKSAVGKKSGNLIKSGLNSSGKYKDSDTDYNIAFADEFDDDSLSNWVNRPGYLNTVTGIATGGTVTFTEDERVRYVKDGKLVFKLYSEDMKDWYQAPELISRDRVTYDYGYLEMKAKLPKGNGVYPGFWVARNYTAYPNSPEIDLMEQFSIDNQFAANVHVWWYVPDATNKLVSKHINKGDQHWFARKITLPEGQTLNDEWHTYGCEITEDQINFYFDGIKFGECSLEKDRMDMFAQLKEIRIGYNKIGSNSSVPMPDKTTVSDFEVEYIHIYQTKALGQIADHF